MCRANHYVVCVCLLCNSEGLAAFLLLQVAQHNMYIGTHDRMQARGCDKMYVFIRFRASYLDWGAIGYSYRHPVGREIKEYKSETVRTRKKTRKCESFIELLVQHTCTYMD